jgi:hypothetical protein
MGEYQATSVRTQAFVKRCRQQFRHGMPRFLKPTVRADTTCVQNAGSDSNPAWHFRPCTRPSTALENVIEKEFARANTSASEG